MMAMTFVIFCVILSFGTSSPKFMETETVEETVEVGKTKATESIHIQATVTSPNVNYTPPETYDVSVSTAGYFTDPVTSGQTYPNTASLSPSKDADAQKPESMAVKGKPAKLKTGTPQKSTLPPTLVQGILHSPKLLKKVTIRPKINHPRIKTFGDNNDDDGVDDEDGDEVNKSKSLKVLKDYDYGDYDSIYSLVHFQQEVYAHVEERAEAINESVQAQVIHIQRKLNQLEKQLTDDVGLRCNLQSTLLTQVNPKQGDIRLLARDNCFKVVTAGYLQFYTGSEWGFICDDFFNSAASKVACYQLGLTHSTIENQSAGKRQGKFRQEQSFDGSWAKSFSIVLDDVQCSGHEGTVNTCYHSDIGKHDCNMDEIVYLACKQDSIFRTLS